MTTLLLQPPAKQLFEVKPQHSHPKLSLRRVLWVKLLRWIDQASPQALWKTSARLSCVTLISVGVLLPEQTFQTLLAIFTWNSGRISILCSLLLFLLNAKRVYLFCKRRSVRRRGSNQHLYHGIPVGEFASWLMEAKAFKRDDVMAKWALSQGAYAKIAEELEAHGILTRGDNNARVLRDITMEQLVLQLRDKFPLVWSEERQVWAERNGAMERWALSHDFQQRKLKEETARKERKLERLDRQIQQRASIADVLALCPPTAQ